MSPPFHIKTPGPDEFVTTKSLIIGAQFALRRKTPARSFIGVDTDGLPLLSRDISLIIVEDPIMYALNPTTGLSSIIALSIITPLVLTSNAANPRPGVFAPGPPVPLIIRSWNAA